MSDKPKSSSDRIKIDRLEVSVYDIPTSAPESDGTFEWNKTTLVVVDAYGGGERGLGYTYADGATARFVHEHLAKVVADSDAMNVPAAWAAMVRAIRNVGRPGVASMAISAVDVALWDLKSRILRLPLAALLGAMRPSVPVYGSGGFTSMTQEQLETQLGGWVAQGIPRVKMKVGTHPDQDLARVRGVRAAIGPNVELFVDANGAYARKQALAFAAGYVAAGVSWFEEPVSSDDLDGLHLIRDRAPAGLEIAAGEYGYDMFYFRRMLDASAVDVLQADGSRCGGVTGFLQAAALCEAHGMPLSAHCAPSLHLHPCIAAPRLRNLEYFHDHVRIEQMLFDGAAVPHRGALEVDYSRPGIGLELKRQDARRFAVS